MKGKLSSHIACWTYKVMGRFSISAECQRPYNSVTTKSSYQRIVEIYQTVIHMLEVATDTAKQSSLTCSNVESTERDARYFVVSHSFVCT
jgi:hypothetical protein